MIDGRWARARQGLGLALLLFIALPPFWVELRPDRPWTAHAAGLADAGRTYRVFVADWGYHTSIILEQATGWRLGPAGKEGSPFVEYAWGDRRFYMESDYRPHAVLAALFLPTDAVTYVDGWPGPPTSGAGMRSLLVRAVSAEELIRLTTELERWRAGTHPYPAVPGYAGRFYPAPGRYLWWNDCNRWTVERLRTAGLASGGRGVLFSGQVAPRLRRFQPASVAD